MQKQSWNSSTTKVGEHIPSSFSMFIISSFKNIEDKFNVYRDKDCMKRFWGSLREHAIGVIKFKKKKNWPSSKNNIKMQTIVTFVQRDLNINMLSIKIIVKLGTIVIMQQNIKVLDIAYANYNNIPNENPTASPNRSNYDYHFIIKELAEEFVKQLSCLGENTK